MRIDLLLRSLCLVPTRSQARAACEAGAVLLGGAAVKPSREVRAGDVVQIRRAGKILSVEILEVPERRPSKKEARSCYRVIDASALGEPEA